MLAVANDDAQNSKGSIERVTNDEEKIGAYTAPKLKASTGKPDVSQVHTHSMKTKRIRKLFGAHGFGLIPAPVAEELTYEEPDVTDQLEVLFALPLPELPGVLVELVSFLLIINPSERLQTLAWFEKRLRAIMKGEQAMPTGEYTEDVKGAITDLKAQVRFMIEAHLLTRISRERGNYKKLSGFDFELKPMTTSKMLVYRG